MDLVRTRTRSHRIQGTSRPAIDPTNALSVAAAVGNALAWSNYPANYSVNASQTYTESRKKSHNQARCAKWIVTICELLRGKASGQIPHKYIYTLHFESMCVRLKIVEFAVNRHVEAKHVNKGAMDIPIRISTQVNRHGQFNLLLT